MVLIGLLFHSKNLKGSLVCPSICLFFLFFFLMKNVINLYQFQFSRLTDVENILKVMEIFEGKRTRGKPFPSASKYFL